ncbi:MAG: hypothetical protein R3Y05_05615 [bacterium]
MIIIDLLKYIEVHNNYKLIASFSNNNETNKIINELKILAKKYDYKYEIRIKQFISKSEYIILEEYKIN